MRAGTSETESAFPQGEIGVKRAATVLVLV